MKGKDSQGKNWRNNFVFVLLILVILIFIASFVATIGFAIDRWWSDNTIDNAPQPLEVAIAILTLLIAVVAIVMGIITWITRSEWRAFQEKQEPIIKETKEELEKLKIEQEEMRWITKLKEKVLPTDPYLRKEESQEVVDSIASHYKKDQDDEAWEMYGVGRSFDKKQNYHKSIKYYEEAIKKSGIDENLMNHIDQSLGIDYFRIGRQLEAKGNNKEQAIEQYEKAIQHYDSVIKRNPEMDAYTNKGITLIQLGKIEGNKSKFEDAISCFDEIIKMEPDNYDHHYDRARALALLNRPDIAIESLTRSFKLVKLEQLNNLLKHLTDDLEDFKNVEEKEGFKALIKRYTDILKADN